MAVFDTGPIDNRDVPRTTQLTIRLFNTGRLPALVGIEVYQINPSGAGFTSETVYVVSLVPLEPFGTLDSGFALDNVFADLDVFGVRVLTSGLGANDIAITVLEKGSAAEIIEKHVLEGELSRIQELLFAYVTNVVTEDSVTVYNTGTNTIVTTITLPAGSGPGETAITPDGSRAYVANSNSSVTVINTATNTILTTIPFPAISIPRGIAITPDGSRAYVANLFDSITVIDTTTNTILTTIPVSANSAPANIAITPDGSRAYVSASGTPDSVIVIDTTTNTVLTTIPLPATSDPDGIAITPDGLRAYVVNEGNDSVTVIDTATNTILTTIVLTAGSTPRRVAIAPDGSRAYVTNSDIDTVSVINTATNTVLTTIFLPVGSHPFGIALIPDGSRAYLTTANSSVTVIDLAVNAFIVALPAGGFNPSAIAITPILLF